MHEVWIIARFFGGRSRICAYIQSTLAGAQGEPTGPSHTGCDGKICDILDGQRLVYRPILFPLKHLWTAPVQLASINHTFFIPPLFIVAPMPTHVEQYNYTICFSMKGILSKFNGCKHHSGVEHKTTTDISWERMVALHWWAWVSAIVHYCGNATKTVRSNYCTLRPKHKNS